MCSVKPRYPRIASLKTAEAFRQHLAAHDIPLGLECVGGALKRGETLHEALADSGLFTSDFLNLVASAEEGGRVPERMRHQATRTARPLESVSNCSIAT